MLKINVTPYFRLDLLFWRGTEYEEPEYIDGRIINSKRKPKVNLNIIINTIDFTKNYKKRWKIIISLFI